MALEGLVVRCDQEPDVVSFSAFPDRCDPRLRLGHHAALPEANPFRTGSCHGVSPASHLGPEADPYGERCRPAFYLSRLLRDDSAGARVGKGHHERTHGALSDAEWRRP